MTAPISWLTLEQLAAGLLPDDEAARVAAAVAESPELARRLSAIEADLRAVPPLPEALPPDSGLPLPAPRARVVPLRARWAVGAAVALAASALLLVRPPSPDLAPAATRYKGGQLALTVDRLRDGAVASGATTFRDGDRLQLRLTCPPGERAWTAAVFQGGARTGLPASTVACGNAVRLPAAFTVEGAALVACVAVDGAHPLDTPPGGEAGGVVCQALAPE